MLIKFKNCLNKKGLWTHNSKIFIIGELGIRKIPPVNFSRPNFALVNFPLENTLGKFPPGEFHPIFDVKCPRYVSNQCVCIFWITGECH